MSSEILRHDPVQSIAPVLWRVVHGALSREQSEVSISQQLDHKFQEGRQQGLSEALSIARREADAKVEAVLERLARSIHDAAEARRRVREETAAEVVRLAISIAMRILHREITLDPDAVHGLLKAAFNKMQSREVTRVLVHPDHEAAVRRFLEQVSNSVPIDIAADPRLERGAMILETAQGDLDASIDTQLKEIERGLADRINY